MLKLPFFIAFIVSLIIFLSGLFPLSYLGLNLCIAALIVWGLATDFLHHLAGAITAGLILDSYSSFPFGTHMLLFILTAIVVFGGKRFLVSHFFWGDVYLALFGIIMSDCFFLALVWLLGYHGIESWFTLGFLGLSLVSIVVNLVIIFFILRRLYQVSTVDASPYVV